MTRTSWLWLWGLALVWGGSYLFIKVSLEDMHPVFLVWSRLALAALVLLPLAARAGALRGVPLKPLAVLALVQVVGPFLLVTFGEQHLPSSLTGILVASSPLFTALLAMAGFGAERVTGWSFAGILVGLAGVAMLFGIDLTSDVEMAIGGVMVLTAGLGYAVGATYLRMRFSGLQSIGVAAGSMTMSAAILTVPAAFAVPSSMPDLEGLGSILALGIGGTGVAFLVFYRLIADLGAAKASLVAYIAPAFALGYGAVLLGEPVTAGAVIGLVLILAGSWITAEGRPPGRRGQPLPAPATA